MVLAYLEPVKNKQNVPQVSTSDPRLKLIEDHSNQESADAFWRVDQDDDTEGDLQESVQGTAEKLTASNGRSRLARTRKGSRAEVVRQRIERMDRRQLIEFVSSLVQEYPEIGRKIEEEEELKAGRVTKIVRSIRVEMEELASEPAWVNSWSGEGSIPDYSRVRERLQSLLDSSHADEVVELGEDLWRLGNQQVGSSHDEGETGSQISKCMVVVLRAVTKSSMSIRDQILWIIDTHLSDEYGLLDASDTCLADLRDRKSWSEAADSLLGRLESMPKIQKRADFSTGYRRQGIMNWAIEALERCGIHKDIIPLLTREAPITQCYGTLVEYLLSAKRRAEAKAVAVQGFRETMGSAPGIAWGLEAKLRTIAEQDKDLPLVAAYRSVEFFDRPSFESYKALKTASEAAGHWPAIREATTRFLETGSRPDLQKGEARSKSASKGFKPWPLPCLEISAASEKTARHHFPDTTTLIRIAIHEKDTDAVIRRYDLAKNARFFGDSIRNEVAEAVKKSHPDVSLQIWRNLAEEQIKLVKPAAYEVAARYLRNMRDIYQKTHRLAEWTALIGGIRIAHKPKRSLMQILDTLEAKRIVDT